MRAFAFALAMLLGLSGAAFAQAKQDFVLVNKTGYEISKVFVSASKTNDWEEDVLGDNTLEDDDFLTVRFKGAGSVCKFDIKVVYEEDDSEAIWTDIDLCTTSKVSIFYNKKNDTTSATFE